MLEKRKLRTKDNNNYRKILLLDNSPIVDVNEYGREADILAQEIATPGVNNIALMASYGAGKSSAIETYLHIYRHNKIHKVFNRNKKLDNSYTRISLASFNDTEYKDSDIERSVLQQLLYSQPKRKLPNSKIERTTATSKLVTSLFALTLLIFITSTVLSGLHFGKLFLYEKAWLNWFLLGLASISLFILIWTLLHYKKFSRIKYKDFELDVEQKGDIKTYSGQSLINKFVDEVLYFFESTKIDLVIFEDLDRLEYKNTELTTNEKGVVANNTTIVDKSSAILVKLRELNTLINNSQQCKRKVSFVYAIKDDMIKKQEERTKFFEYILPIIPILNPVTKALKMRELHDLMVKNELGVRDNDKLEHSDYEKSELKLDSEFINAISTYIPNMRILKNTFNEYIISHMRIFKGAALGRLQNENLFALSLYKNLYPYDYSKLEQDSGLIPIVMDKSSLIKDKIEESNQNIKKNNDLINKAEKENLESFAELREIFKGKLPGIKNIFLNGAWHSVDSLKTFQGIVFGNTQYQYNYGYGFSNGVIPGNTALPNGESFVERENNINNKTNEGKERLAKLIEIERQNILKYESMTLKELIKESGIDIHFNALSEKEETKKYLAGLKNAGFDKEEEYRLNSFNKDSKQLGYLKFLIQNGYVDEKYLEYISGYESNTMSSFDEEFIRKVQQGELDFNHRIDNPLTVINHIRESNFSEPAILNKTILENLDLIKLQTKNNKFRNICNLLKKEIVYDIIRKFIQSAEQGVISKFLSCIIKSGNTEVCGNLLSDSQLVKEKKDLVAMTLIEAENDYVKHNTNNIITKYFERSNNYIELLKNISLDKAKSFLLQIAPRFHTLYSEDSEITNFAIENNLYQINIENLIKVFGISNEEKFYHNNYEFISSNVDVKNYIYVNINEYVQNVFTCNSNEFPNSDERSDIIIDLLNRENITLMNQYRIIEKYSFKIVRLQDYNDELHKCLLEYNRVQATWSNILFAYYKNIDFNETIKVFLIKNANEIQGEYKLDVEEIEEDETSKQICESLFVDIINADYTSEELINLKAIASSLNISYELNERYASDETLSIFIAAGKFPYNKGSLQYLLDKHKSLQTYVCLYDNMVNDDFDEFFMGIDSHALKLLILFENIGINIKQKLITEYGGKIIVNGFEKEFYNTFTGSSLKIPVVLLMRFVDCTNLTNDEKVNLALLASDKEDIVALPLFMSYMENIFPELNGDKKAFNYSPTSEIKHLLSIYACGSGRKMRNHHDGSVTIYKKEN